MSSSPPRRPTIGVLPGWEVYENANLVNYLGPLLYGIRAAARERQCNLLMACGMGFPGGQMGGIQPAWPEPSPDTYFIPVGPFNTDGLIVVNPLVSEARMAYVRDLAAAGQHVVFIGTALDSPAVAIDNQGGIQRAVTHLVEHGHRRIAFIAGSPNDLHGDSEERLRAYRNALRRCGLEAEPELIAYGLHIVEGGRMAMQQILASGAPFTAVLGSSDECAIGAMQVLKESGLRIPDDIAVVGFDDGPEAVVQDPPLTSVHSPTFERGYRALELALDYVQGRRQRRDVLTVPARLTVRESCGCPLREGGRAGIPGSADVRAGITGPASTGRLSHAMAEAVLGRSHRLSPAEVQASCREVVDAFQAALQAGEAEAFHRTLGEILRRVGSAGEDALFGDDAHAWLGSVAALRESLPALLEAAGPGPRQWAESTLFQASQLVMDAVQRRHEDVLIEQKWTADRMASLTAHLFAALDEAQIFAVLSERLPELGIPHAAVVFYEAEGEGQAAASLIRTIPGGWDAYRRFPSRDFPPLGVYPPKEPYSLALVPLVIRARQAGFVAFDAARLDLCGAIVQQLGLALHSAQLYREAIEGRLLAEEGRRLAEAANQMKSRFLSTVSHELRTPLTVISGLSDRLLAETQRGGSRPDALRDQIERIHASAEHLDGLIRDVLDLAQNQVGQLKLACEPLDLLAVLKAAAVVGEQLAGDKGLSWRLEAPRELPTIWGDPTRLRQVLLNLINNAVKFTAQGEVSLRAIATGERITVIVGDTGLGIRKDEQKTIFDEFRQSERTARRGFGGLGLGLAICKRLVEMHRGEIRVESTGEEGCGSRFFVDLPAMDQALAAEPELELSGRGQTVLVLSNRPGGGEYLRARLIERGFRAVAAEVDSSQGWLSRLLSRPLGAAVLDTQLDSEQGWEIVRALKENPATRDVPILFYSLSPDEDAGSLLSLDYLTKPVGTHELEQALRQHGLVGQRGGKTILIVDDEPSILEMHARVIQGTARALRVLKARDGREALSLIRQELPDLVLLDLLMPELDGFGVLEVMQSEKSLSSIPVIVLTGQSLTSDEMRRLNRGVAAVLSKGVYSVAETAAFIAEALARSPRLGSARQRLARRAMAYFHEHYDESISRDEIAASLGVSKDHLTRCFHEETSLTLTAYLRRVRIQRAKEMLAEGEKSVTEVALAVGFSDSNYFARAFRQETGQSPRDFRHS